MSVKDQIKEYLASQPDAKRDELNSLHKMILGVEPKAKLWYFDGLDEKGKVVANPQIGYGAYTMTYTNGKTREFYRVGLSANTTGISVYIMGLDDKKYLAETYGKQLGKASVTGYCIKFKSLKDIDSDVLASAVRDRFEREN